MKNLAIILLFLCTTHLSAQSPLDIDLDDDGLIEINDLETLNAMRYQLDGSGLKMSAESTKTTTGCATGGCIGYELTTNLDFLDDASYSSTANKVMWTVIDYEDSTDSGWQPIGSFIDQFITAFEGNNHTISNLMINRTDVDYVGLFGYVGSGAEIANIGLLNVNIVGYDFVSGLVGYSEGSIMNSYVTGTVEGASEVGGLVGLNEGNIADSYATSAVEGNEEGMGGLVGRNDGNIANSYATGAVEGNEEGVGGLVGRNEGNIENSYATGTVEGDADVGGLAGIQGERGNITNSYAAGTVVGRRYVGGLAGTQWAGSNITNSYAIGTVTGNNRVGGLVGSQWFGGDVANSYAAGAVEGNEHVGGLVGVQWYGGNITNSYASGAVEGDQRVGGLVGSQWFRGDIANSYATGTVEGNQRTGGLIGDSSGGIITYSYWDKTTSGIETSDGGEAKTTAELQSPTKPGTTQTEVYYSWSKSDWDFGTDQQYPISKYTLGDENNPACQSPTGMLNLPICGYPLLPITRYGLIDVRLVEGNLSPDFITTAMHYTGTVVSSVSAVQLIPTAVNPEAEISIIVNNEKESIKSGTTSTVITLAADATTDIILEIMNSATTTGTVEYTLRLKYYHYDGGDVDKDNDGLIEISDLEGLNAMRYQLDGTGYRKSANTPKITVGCSVGGCNGYELTTDLDFLADDSYSSAVNKAEWTVESYKDGADNGWQPIGDFDNQFIAFFEGNNHTISNLMINRPSVNYIGLFGYAESATKIVNISLPNVRIVGRNFVGSLVGFIKASSSITNSYARGEVKGGRKVGGLVGRSEGHITNSYAAVEVKGRWEIGGLVGHSESNITNSYATGAVKGQREIGGLVGWAEGNITNSYASGAVEGDSSVGGLVGVSTASSISNSYWDTDTSGIETSDGGEAKTTDDLQLPTTPTDTIYVGWRTADWDFGNSSQYPILKYTIGDDRTNPACGVSQQPECGTLLQRQRNHQPRITYPTSATQIEILASDPTTKTIDVTVIDEDVGDKLTILLLAEEGQTILGLVSTTAEVLPTGSEERELSLKIRIPTRTIGSIAELRLTAEDDSGFANAMSEPIAFKVAVLSAGNTPPTITLSAPSEIRLLEEASTTLNVVVMDADNDSLSVSVRSDDDAIATATIVATDGATRTLEVMGVANAGAATITVTVDDGRGESNSKASVTFMVIVEENTAPSLSITPPTEQNLQLGETSSIVVSVSDNNFDVGDMVTVTVSSLPSSVVATVSTEETDITQDTTISFILNAINAGTAAITITATDRQGETTSTTLNVHVNAPPEIVGYDEEVSVVIDRVRNINIVVSDVNIDDELTLTLSVAEMGRALVQLATTSVTVIANGMAQQTPLAITGLQPGVTTLTVVVSDGREGKTQKHIKIIVRPHVIPVIDASPPFADIAVLPKTDRIYTIMVNERDYDVPGSLEVEVLSSSTPTVAVELEDTTTTGTYSLILTSQSVLSSATITVRVNDNKGEMAIVTFNVNVVANQSPSLTITPSTDPIRNLQLNSTASLMIVVSDANYDMGDAVTIKVVATPSSVVLVEPTEITGITSIDIQKIMLDAVASGNAAITITATDRLGASTSTTIVVYVDDRSVMVAIAASDANEGETVLIEPMISGASEDHLSYQWRVIAGTTTTRILQRVMMATSTLSFRIADDYIKDTSNQNATQELQIELVVTEQTTDPISVSQTVMVTITKKDNDNADLGTVIVDPDNSRSLSFPELDLASDSDGEIATNTIVYQWQKYNMEGSNWEDISSAMSRSYPIAVTDTSGDRFRVSVTYTDGQGYTKTLHSNEYTYGRSIMVRTKVFLEGPLR